MVTMAVPPRLYVLLARDAPVGVIFRRGPTDWTEMIRWDIERDTFERGEWLRGTVYPRRSDLSPDGGLLVYAAAEYASSDEERRVYSAVSRPPFFHPLARWDGAHLAGGGGEFEGSSRLRLNHPSLEGPDLPREAGIVVRPYAEPMHGGAERARMIRDGWWVTAEPDGAEVASNGVTAQPEVMERPLGDVLLRRTRTWLGRREIRKYDLVYADVSLASIPSGEWADVDREDRLVYTRHGQVWVGEWDGNFLISKSLLDLREDRPRVVTAPPSVKGWQRKE